MSRRWLRFGVKPQVAGLGLAGYSTAVLIRSEGSITRLKSQTKRKQNSPPLCYCIAVTAKIEFLGDEGAETTQVGPPGAGGIISGAGAECPVDDFLANGC
jgi:hypothetical protein